MNSMSVVMQYAQAHNEEVLVFAFFLVGRGKNPHH